MSLRTLMQAGPTKINELFARLSETSDGAVKTREKLVGELKAELELHASLEEQYLFPLLRRQAETKALVVDATRDNRELRTKLAELETLPKNDEAFPERLKDLQKAFRQHARDEKRELLPAVQLALSEEQVGRVTEKIEAGIAEAERARHEDAEAQRAKARQEREKAEQERKAAAEQERKAAAEQAQAAELKQKQAQEREAKEQKAAAQRASVEAERRVNDVVDTARQAAETTQTNVVQLAEVAVADTRHVVAGTTQAIASDLGAAASLSRVAMDAAAEMRSAWMECMQQTAVAGTKASQTILCRAAEQQQQFASKAVQHWMERNARLVQLGLDMALVGWRPFSRISGIGLYEPRRDR